MMSAASDRRHFGPETSGHRPPLQEVSETEASGAIGAIYRDIKEIGGYATVPLLYRQLAVRVGCLEWAWRFLRLGYASGEIPRSGDRFTVDVGAVTPFSTPVMNAQGVSQEQRQIAKEVVRAFNSANPMNLIAAHLIDAAAQSGVGPHWDASETRRAAIPVRPSSSRPPQPVPPEEMLPRDRQLLEWLSSSGGRSPAVLLPTLYRVLARMPALLTLIACRLDPIFADGSIARKASELESSAARICKEFSGVREIESECPAPELVSEIVAPFRSKVAEMLVVGALIETFVSGAVDD
jgi:hypothetical protein